jgi:hypothetical protein
MKDDRDKREGQTGSAAKNPRQDRLKLALRENLKRRKSQAKGRSETTGRSEAAIAPSEHDGQSPHEPGGKAK